VIALAFFVPLRLFVLRHDNAYQRAYLTFFCEAPRFCRESEAKRAAQCLLT
jgi:hypothetical protein